MPHSRVISFWRKLFFSSLLIGGVLFLDQSWSQVTPGTTSNLKTKKPQRRIVRAVPVLRSYYELFFGLQASPFNIDGIDASNRLLELPKEKYFLELRPNWTYERNPREKFIVRARALVDSTRIQYKSPEDSRTKTQSKLDLSDAFYELLTTRSSKIVAGLHTYQWGQAELLNVSNPLFHFNTQQRTTFYKEKGLVLLRANVDWSETFNQVLIAEALSNNEASWVAEEDFRPQFLTKLELTSQDQLHSFGLVLGSEKRGKAFIGEYFSYSPWEGVSFYADARQTFGVTSYSPVVQDSFTVLAYDDTKKSPQTMALAGFRYENSWLDFRTEYFYNQPGWNKEQFKSAVQAIQTFSPYLAMNFNRFSHPGLELMGQQYLYNSMRFINLGHQGDMSAAARLLTSLQDSSKVLQTSFDTSLGDHLEVSLSATIGQGERLSELNFLGQSLYQAGFRLSF